MLRQGVHPCWALFSVLNNEPICRAEMRDTQEPQRTVIASISCLPALVLERILSCLDTRSKCSALCVSKEWAAVCGQPEHWRSIDISCSNDQQAPTAAELYKVFHRSQGHVVRLVLSSSGKSRRAQEQKRFELGIKREQPLPDTRGSSALFIASILPKLQQLVLDERASSIGGMTDDFAKAVSKGCGHLQHFEVLFQRYSVPSELFTDVGMIAIAEGCRSLQVVALKNCTTITDRSMYAIAASCKQLKEFKFGGYSERLTDGGLVVLFEACPRLEKVWLCSKLLKVTDESIQALAGNCHQLSKIKMPSRVTDVAILELASMCPALQEVDLKKCFQISQHSVMSMLEACHKLKGLKLPDKFYTA